MELKIDAAVLPYQVPGVMEATLGLTFPVYKYILTGRGREFDMRLQFTDRLGSQIRAAFSFLT